MVDPLPKSHRIINSLLSSLAAAAAAAGIFGVISRCSHFWLLRLTVAHAVAFIVHSSNIFAMLHICSGSYEAGLSRKLQIGFASFVISEVMQCTELRLGGNDNPFSSSCSIIIFSAFFATDVRGRTDGRTRTEMPSSFCDVVCALREIIWTEAAAALLKLIGKRSFAFVLGGAQKRYRNHYEPSSQALNSCDLESFGIPNMPFSIYFSLHLNRRNVLSYTRRSRVMQNLLSIQSQS